MPDDLKLMSFQRAFLKGALHPSIRTAALSLPRGNGKTTLAGWLASRIISPGDRLFREGSENYIFAASLSQAQRTIFRQMRSFLDESRYRIADSANNTCHAIHISTGTKITALAANAKTAQGLVGAHLCICDEPGSWQTVGGEALHDAIQTAQGKPGSDMRVIYIGTLAPATEGWWHDLIAEGSSGSQYVMALQADPKKWDRLREIRRVNPLMYAFPESREVLKDELEKAKADSRLKARFLSYRLNVPSMEESAMLLAVSDWERMVRRSVPDREGRPVIGVDLGAGRIRLQVSSDH